MNDLMSSTCSAKSGDSAPGCWRSWAQSVKIDLLAIEANENGLGISRPSTTRASCGGGGGASAAARNSLARWPDRPRPRSMRPGWRASRVPNCSTTPSAVWWPSWTAPEPTRIVLVAAATAPIRTAGAELATPGVKWCSASQ